MGYFRVAFGSKRHDRNKMQDIIDQWVLDAQTNHDAFLIEACRKKGLVMSIDTANQYRENIILNKDYKILEHVPTGTLICKYSKEPEIIHNGDTIRAEWKFEEIP